MHKQGIIKPKKSRKRSRLKSDYSLLEGSVINMDYVTWRAAPKYHSKFLKERYKMTVSMRKAVLEKYRYKCVVCGSNKDLQVDHIIPISKGGKTVIKNLQILCRVCNLHKHNKTMDEFLKWRQDHGTS